MAKLLLKPTLVKGGSRSTNSLVFCFGLALGSKNVYFPAPPPFKEPGSSVGTPMPAQPFLQDQRRVIKCFFCWTQKSQIPIPILLLVFIPLIPPLWLFLTSNANPRCTRHLSSAKSRLGLELNGAMRARCCFFPPRELGYGVNRSCVETKQVADVVYEPLDSVYPGELLLPLPG